MGQLYEKMGYLCIDCPIKGVHYPVYSLMSETTQVTVKRCHASATSRKHAGLWTSETMEWE